MFLGDGKAQCLGLTLGKCVYHPDMCTSYELLFDLGCCLITKKFRGSPPTSQALLVPKKSWNFQKFPLGLEAQIRPVVALALRFINCGLHDFLLLFYFSP